MRPNGTVARAGFSAALALGALPGLVGSHEPGPNQPIEDALFEQVIVATAREAQAGGPFALDLAASSAGTLDLAATFAEAGPDAPVVVGLRPAPALPSPNATWTWKPAGATISGAASFYDSGTTAMRDVARGTAIVICGRGGCIERVVTDYGPAKSTGRVIDMYRPDFFAICGCGWWSGTTTVTVRVY